MRSQRGLCRIGHLPLASASVCTIDQCQSNLGASPLLVGLSDFVGLGMLKGEAGDLVEGRLIFHLQAIAHNGLLFASRHSDRDRYCVLRDIAVEMMAACSDARLEDVVATFDGGEGYATPRIDVRCAIFDRGRLRLVPAESDGEWGLPGGWAAPNVSPSENARRHVSSVLGCSVRIERVLAVWEEFGELSAELVYPTYHIVFLCSGEGESSVKVGELFSLSEVEHLSLSPSYRGRLMKLFSLAEGGRCESDFD
jgi:ADP-ribose pyrophosphatase YjhB (NUDIX family)